MNKKHNESKSLGKRIELAQKQLKANDILSALGKQLRYQIDKEFHCLKAQKYKKGSTIMISNLATPLINKNKLVQDEINEDNKKNDRRQNQSNITDLENSNREIVDTVDDKIDY